jgi:sigma-B regulation protein RsbU (phosphoserine phosphatase)
MEANYEHFRQEFVQGRGRALSLLTRSYSSEEERLTKALEELQVAYEELQVADEELHQQISELEESHKATETLYARYQNLFEFAPDGYVVTDPLGMIQEANPVAARLLNIRPEYLAGKPLRLFLPEMQTEFDQWLKRLRHDSQGDQKREVRLHPRNRKPIYAEISAASNPFEATGETSIRWLIRDLTDQRQAQDVYDREHAIAETLQECFTPDLPSELPGVEIGHCYLPHGDGIQVGGDFYDLFQLQDGVYGVMIGDVCGKGAEAARITAMAKYALKGFAGEFHHPKTIMQKLDQMLLRHLPSDRFVTAFYGVLDLRNLSFRYANAGHVAGMLERRNGEMEWLSPTGPLLGALKGNVYVERVIRLNPSDCLFLYTDGLIEARQDGIFLGEEGLQELFRQTRTYALNERIRAVEQLASTYCSGCLADDLALLMLQMHPQK